MKMKKKWPEIKNRLIYHRLICNNNDRYLFPNGIGLCALTGTILMNDGLLYPILSVCGIIVWNVIQIYIMNMRKNGYLKDYKLEITDEGFHVEDKEYKGIIKWSRFKKIIEDNDTLLVFSKDRNLPMIIDKSIYEEPLIETVKSNIQKIKKVEFSLRNNNI